MKKRFTEAQIVGFLREVDWSSQGLVETLFPRPMSGFELLRTDAGEITMPARPIVERIDVVSYVRSRQRAVLVDLLLDAFLL